MKSPRITDIVFDFDGTCTRIPAIYENFLQTYYEGFAAQMETAQHPITAQQWKDALELVRKNSPHAGWAVKTTPSAPAAADPYILAYEAAKHILRDNEMNIEPDFAIFKKAYGDNAAPLREDAEHTFKALQLEGVQLHFISNSSPEAIKTLLTQLNLPAIITVEGNAAKYSISELTWDPTPATGMIPADVRKVFESLPTHYESTFLAGLNRPVYLRRGSYFEAICRAFNNDLSKMASTVFCGDIWELDLALPYKLGANIHLMEREAPFDTYEYEHKIVHSYNAKAKTGNNLADVLKWIR